jgi:hypothetical protein
VISLHISHNIHSEEAFVREAAMIEAMGEDNTLFPLNGKNRSNIRTRVFDQCQERQPQRDLEGVEQETAG